jgi:hypothetical protein
MNKKIECIKRLIKKNNAYLEICEWLLERKLITDLQIESHTRLDERAQLIFNILEEAVERPDFQMIDWEWQVLPLELIKITCITETEVKVFSYGL